MIIIGIVLGGFIVFLILRKSKPSVAPTDSMKLILEQINELSRTMDQKMRDTERQVNESIRFQSSESNKLIREITKELTEVKETGKQVVGFAEQLENLQDILKNPKQRGILGEYYLETVLKNVLPPRSFEMQYKFINGDIVDAVVFVKDKIIPIDSKFSLENYNRLTEEKNETRRAELEKQFKNDLKLRIDETAKYVRPSEGTMDFAFMFIPHEAIYYDLLVAQVGGVKVNTRDLIEYAFKEKKVIIVSPTSFLAFLQTVLQGLKALQIEEKATEIIKRVEDLGRHIKSYEDFHNRLGNSLGTVINHYNSSGKELKKIDKDVVRITGDTFGSEPVVLDNKINKE